VSISWINGHIVHDDLAISVNDRGFLLGDGVFETFLCQNSRAIFAERHVSRLNFGLKTLQIDYIFSVKILSSIVDALYGATPSANAMVLRLTVSRGAGGRGLGVPGGIPPTIVARLTSLPSKSNANGMVVVTNYQKTGSQFSRFKNIGGYQENILARMEADSLCADDALLIGKSSEIVCASSANVFAVDQSGMIWTAAIEDGALPGVVRGILLEQIREQQLPIKKTGAGVSILPTMALVLTNSIIGVKQVAMLGQSAPNGNQNLRIEQLKLMYSHALEKDRKGGLKE